jgi:hypothetical protein
MTSEEKAILIKAVSLIESALLRIANSYVERTDEQKVAEIRAIEAEQGYAQNLIKELEAL